MNPTNEYKEKNIKVAVFDKTSKEGKPYKSISIQKSNKDKDGVWKNETIYLFENEAKILYGLLNKLSSDTKQGNGSFREENKFIEDNISDDIPFNDAVSIAA